MTAHARLPPNPARAQSPISQKGEGLVLATGAKPVPVVYELLLERVSGELTKFGNLHARRSTIEEMWLEPIVMLRTEDGRHIDISITHFDEKKALFEIIEQG